MLAIDGVAIHRQPPLLLKFHKPFDVISSMDEKQRTDLSDALPGLKAPWDEDAVLEKRVEMGGRVSRRVSERTSGFKRQHTIKIYFLYINLSQL